MTEKADAQTQGALFAETLGCTGADLLACLRGKPIEAVITALPAQSFGVGKTTTTWSPTVDGVTLPARPLTLLEQGSFEHVPTILGSNSDEGTLFFQLAATKVSTEADFQMLAELLVPGQGAEIVSRYPTSDYGTPQGAAEAAVKDAGFVCPTRRAARALTKGGAPAYLYHFRYGPTSLLGELGAFHSAEIKFVLGNPGPLLPLPLTDEELAFSARIQAYWHGLASGGDPNLNGGMRWEPYDLMLDQNLSLDLGDIKVEHELRREPCDYWDTVQTDVF